MPKRRYGVKAVFTDPDFDLGSETKKFWTRKSANFYWYDREVKWRRPLSDDSWKYIVIDLNTEEDITPNM